MLVLSRKSNESIMIGTNVEIIVLGVEGDNVKLGIRAPKEVEIYRKEIYMAIQTENQAAANNSLSIEDVSKWFKT